MKFACFVEIITFGACLGLNTQDLFHIISNAGGNSWMFGDYVPHMSDNEIPSNNIFPTYNILIDASFKQGKFEEAMNLFHEMPQKHIPLYCHKKCIY